MNFRSITRCTRVLAGALGILLLAGCASLIRNPDPYEYRYRVFEAPDPLPAVMKEPISQELIQKRFIPVGAVNIVMDALTQEGFTLATIERIHSSNSFLFTFRRELPNQGYKPTSAPLEFIGVYQAEPPYSATTYYVFTPRLKGYQVALFDKGQETRFIDADWDGARLTVQEGDVQHSFTLSNNGLVLSHIQDSLVPNQLKRTTVTMRRIQSGQ